MELTSTLVELVRVGATSKHLGAVAHAIDAGLGGQRSEAVTIDVDRAQLGEPNHLADEIASIVEEVEQADIGVVAVLPPRVEVMEHGGQRHQICRRPLGLDEHPESHARVRVGWWSGWRPAHPRWPGGPTPVQRVCRTEGRECGV